MGQDFGDFGAGDAVLLGFLQMIGERTVRNALAHQRGKRNEAAVAEAQQMIAAPHFPKENVVVEMREFGRELAERVLSGGLYDFLLCHDLQCYWYKKAVCVRSRLGSSVISVLPYVFESAGKESMVPAPPLPPFHLWLGTVYL